MQDDNTPITDDQLEAVSGGAWVGGRWVYGDKGQGSASHEPRLLAGGKIGLFDQDGRMIRNDVPDSPGTRKHYGL